MHVLSGQNKITLLLRKLTILYSYGVSWCCAKLKCLKHSN